MAVNQGQKRIAIVSEDESALLFSDPILKWHAKSRMILAKNRVDLLIIIYISSFFLFGLVYHKESKGAMKIV